MDDKNPDKDMNLYKEIGNIQGTLHSLVSTVNQGFSRFQRDLSDLKSEVHNNIISLNKRLDKIDEKVEKLEVFKAGYDGSKEESKRIASLAGTLWGSLVAVVISVFSWFVNHIHLFFNNYK